MTPGKLYLSGIRVRNLRGVKSFDAKLSMISVIVGENGVGKTTLLSSIAEILEGGHDPDEVMNGADEATIELTLSDGSQAIKTITRAGYNLDVRNPDGSPKKAPATWLKSLAPGLAFDPISFLAADPKERAAFLLKTIPLTFTAAEVDHAVGAPTATGPVSLQRLNEIRDGKYEERKNLNVERRNLEGTIADMTKALPDDEGAKDWGAERDRLAAEVSGIDGEIARLATEIELEAEQSRNEKSLAIRKQIDALEMELGEFLTMVNHAAAQCVAEQTGELKARQNALSLDLGTARAKADEQQRSAGVRNAIDERKKSFEGYTLKEIRLTDTLNAIDSLKNQKLRELPIEGLDLRSDSRGRPVILVDGIALDKLNRQKQIYLAIQAVSLACGQMPVMICEVAELDEPHIVELSEAANSAGIQLVLATRMRDEPLAVMNLDEYRQKVGVLGKT